MRATGKYDEVWVGGYVGLIEKERAPMNDNNAKNQSKKSHKFYLGEVSVGGIKVSNYLNIHCR